MSQTKKTFYVLFYVLIRVTRGRR